MASANGKIGKGIPHSFGFSPQDLRTLRTLKTPARIQKFLDALPYQVAQTHAWSPQRVLRTRKGHCLEGALLAATTLRVHGHPPLLMDLEGIRDDDHVVALYSNTVYGEALPNQTSQVCDFVRRYTALCASLRSVILRITTTFVANAACALTQNL